MLFVFPEEAYRSFWMKNTLIPLDILFLDSHGVVVDVQTMTPQIGAPDSELARYQSAAPARYALEMNAGLALGARHRAGGSSAVPLAAKPRGGHSPYLSGPPPSAGRTPPQTGPAHP